MSPPYKFTLKCVMLWCCTYRKSIWKHITNVSTTQAT